MPQKGRRHRAKNHNRGEKREEAKSRIPSDRAVGPYTPAPAGGCAGTDPEGGDKSRARVTSPHPLQRRRKTCDDLSPETQAKRPHNFVSFETPKREPPTQKGVLEVISPVVSIKAKFEFDLPVPKGPPISLAPP